MRPGVQSRGLVVAMFVRAMVAGASLVRIRLLCESNGDWVLLGWQILRRGRGWAGRVGRLRYRSIGHIGAHD